MLERRGKLLIDGSWKVGTLRCDGALIDSVELEEKAPDEAKLPYITPGLIDLHVHGFGGAGPLDDLAGMARALALEGTTAFLPTLFPDEPARLGKVASGVWSGVRGGALEGAVLGLHLEGPFVNPSSAGALPPERLAEPSPAGVAQLLGQDGNGVRIVTVAPEIGGGADAVRELVQSGVHVSLGHSLASAAQARAAAKAGAAGATHLFNAMAPLHHRNAGLANFALSDDALVAEIIGDLVHVGAEAFELALRARGPLGLALVSDALRGAGTGCDVLHSHGHACIEHGGAFYIAEDGKPSQRLAGAAASQLEAIRRLDAAGVANRAELFTMATSGPARALGLEAERGALRAGARADLLLLDAALGLSEVIVAGTPLAT